MPGKSSTTASGFSHHTCRISPIHASTPLAEERQPAEPHLCHQLFWSHAESLRGARSLHRQPDESAALEDSPPAATACEAEPAVGIEKDPSGWLGIFIICNFCIHRNQSSDKNGGQPPMPNNFRILSPALMPHRVSISPPWRMNFCWPGLS
jgi:hypothetical protein